MTQLCVVWLVVIALLHPLSISLSGVLIADTVCVCVHTDPPPSPHSLTLIDSSLPLEAEPQLRTYISRRLSKGALLGGMGNIATVELR